jgi:transporter family protein
MRAEFWAVLTACCWGVGALLEKKGVKIGGLAPVMGVAIRTVFSMLILLAASSPFWGQMKTAGVKSFTLIAVGGGLFAGSLGLICLYSGLKTGNLSTVMAISFSLVPIIGAILGVGFLGEKLKAVQIIGIALCVAGAAMVTYFKQT